MTKQRGAPGTDPPPSPAPANQPTEEPASGGTPPTPAATVETPPLPKFERSFFGNPFGTRAGKFEVNLGEGFRLPDRSRPAKPAASKPTG